MKYILFIFGVSLCLCFVTASEGGTCKLKVQEMDKEWLKMVGGCTALVHRQINVEIEASMKYLAMASHFSRDNVNRPGFAEFFFKAASEEREHAIKLIEYLLMRGQLTTHFSQLTRLAEIKVELDDKLSVLEALRLALKEETKVTNSIREIMNECEEPTEPADKETNDYHLVDYLTTEFLEEQYRGQRDLAGRISTLQKMVSQESKVNGPLAEFIYDKKLLKGEI